MHTSTHVSLSRLIPGRDLVDGIGEPPRSAVYARGRLIAQPGEPIWVHCVAEGCARAVSYSLSGRRQISRLYLRGDIIGLQPLAAEVEAASEVLTWRWKRSQLQVRLDRHPGLDALRQHVATREASLVLEHLTVVTRGTAQARVAWLLLKVMHHAGARGGEAFALPLRRCDIADYLALTIETTSRTFSKMRRAKLLSEDTARKLVVIHGMETMRKIVDDV